MKKYFSHQYIWEHIKGYSAFREDGNRTWKIDEIREKKVEALVEIIDPQLGDEILDLGCGLGTFLFYCAKKGANCYGVDTDEDVVNSVREFFTVHPLLGKIELYTGQAEKLLFEDHRFNKVIAIDILEHNNDHSKEEILKEIARVLKANGILIINTPNKIYLSLRTFFKNLYDSLKSIKLIREKIPHTSGSRKGCGEHIGLTNIFQLRNLLRKYGFIYLEQFFHNETVLDKSLFRFYRRVPILKDLLVGSISIQAIRSNSV